MPQAIPAMIENQKYPGSELLTNVPAAPDLPKAPIFPEIKPLIEKEIIKSPNRK